MSNLWPWLAVAGLGALHGLNPATGWIFAAAWGVRSGDRAQALRALAPIAAGHAVSVALVAAAVALGMGMDRGVPQVLAGVLLAAMAAYYLTGRKTRRMQTPAGHAGLALWSFMMSTAHGAGLMLVPALLPLCTAYAPALHDPTKHAPGPFALALLAVVVHTLAMLATTGLVATGVCSGFGAGMAGWTRRRREAPRAALTGPPGCPASGRSAR